MRKRQLSESQLRKIILSEKKKFEKDVKTMQVIREAMVYNGLYDTPIVDINNKKVLNEFLGISGQDAAEALIGGASDLISRSIAQWFLEYLGLRTDSLFGNLIVEIFENAPVLSYWFGRAECDELSAGIGQAVGETFTQPIGMGVLQHLGLDMNNVFGQLFYESVQNNIMQDVTEPLGNAIQSVICVITWRDAAGVATNGLFGTDPDEVKRKIEAAANQQATWRSQESEDDSGSGQDSGSRESENQTDSATIDDPLAGVR